MHADTHHKLREHAVQLIIAGDGECGLHGLQDKILPQPVGDLRVIIALEAAEDKGHTTASTATFTRRHGSLRGGRAEVKGEGWRVRGWCSSLKCLSYLDWPLSQNPKRRKIIFLKKNKNKKFSGQSLCQTKT